MRKKNLYLNVSFSLSTTRITKYTVGGKRYRWKKLVLVWVLVKSFCLCLLGGTNASLRSPHTDTMFRKHRIEFEFEYVIIPFCSLSLSLFCIWWGLCASCSCCCWVGGLWGLHRISNKTETTLQTPPAKRLRRITETAKRRGPQLTHPPVPLVATRVVEGVCGWGGVFCLVSLHTDFWFREYSFVIH